MKIATLVMTHAYPELTADTVESVQTHVGERVLVLVDKVGWPALSSLQLGSAKIEAGFAHGVSASPYRNSALGLLRLYETWPDSDWFLYTEYDCVLLSGTFAHDLQQAGEKNAWCAGFDLRRYSFELPFLAKLLEGEAPRHSYYFLGACLFLSREFMNKLRESRFIERILEATDKFPAGVFPDYKRWAFEEELWPTVAVHFGGSLYELASFRSANTQPPIKGTAVHYSSGEHPRWRGRYPTFAVRFSPEIHPREIAAETAIAHPVKHLHNPIRVQARFQRRESLRRMPQTQYYSEGERPPEQEPSESPSEIVERAVGLAQGGQVQLAIDLFHKAIECQPWFPRAYHNLGVALADLGKPQDAVKALNTAIDQEPDYAEAYFNLGTVLNQLRRSDEAISALRHAHRLRPDHAETLNNLGLALIHHGKADEAIVLLQQALRLKTNFEEAYNNLGLAYADIGEYALAEESYNQSLRLQPRKVDHFNNLANTYMDWGKHERGLACFNLALAYEPKNISVHWNRALAWLKLGRYEQGWPEYEWRLRKPDVGILSFPQPRWDGTPLDGRTILLHAEQGRGDLFQFIRFAPLVKSREGKVVFLCPRDLVGVLSRCPGIDVSVADGTPLPPFDVQASLLSLPAILGTTLENLPTNIPYILPDPDRVVLWQPKISTLPGFKIGIVWQGNPRHKGDRHRSVPLSLFADLARVPGVTLVSLQKGPGSEQIPAFRKKHSIIDLGTAFDDEPTAFENTAAILPHLDLVLTVDTALAHLAGALGIPVWVLLSTHSDWRWLLNRNDSPWYPSLRLFRQEKLGDWPGVMAKVCDEVVRKVRDAGNISR